MKARASGVAIAIVTYGSAADLPDCLAAIGRLRHRPLELAIVDCASADGSPEVARRHAPPGIPLEIVPLAENQGFSGGMNVALRESSAPYVLSLNADAHPEPDFVGRLLARAQAHSTPPTGAVAGRLVRPAGEPRRLDACGMRLTPTWRHLDRGSDQVDRGQLMRAERVFGATGAASLFVREALEDVAVDGDVFLPEFHSFREDAELCFRLRERGWEIRYEPTARAVHRRTNLPRRRRAMDPAVNANSLRNRYLLRLYHQTLDNFLLTLVPTLARDLAILAYVLTRERGSLGVYAWLWRHRARILERRRRIQRSRSVGSARINRWFFRQSLPP